MPRRTRKQYGGNMAKVQKRIRKWLSKGDTSALLDLSSLGLTKLPKLPDNLKYLECDHNELTSLPTLPSNLLYLACDRNYLTTLPPLPDSLEALTCSMNTITSLPPLPNSLEELYCGDNKLKSLPTLPDSLQILECDNNYMKTLPTLPNNLKVLKCSNNLLMSVPKLPNSLFTLDLRYNKLPRIYNVEHHDDVGIDYINRVRKYTNVQNNIQSHITNTKRNVLANKAEALPRNIAREVASYMNEKNLKNVVNINSLKPSKIKRNITRRHHN